MTAIALIGGDGSGKTTVARDLLASSPVPMKYIYMGIHAPSANYSLPTTRLVHFIKVRTYRKSNNGGSDPGSGEAARYRVVERGRLGALVRVVIRISEEMYRQIVSWFFQARGLVVLYDRHYVFEYALNVGATNARPELPVRLHRWFLSRVYPKPDLVILLDAPPEILLERKNEWSEEHHRRQRERFLAQSALVPSFFRVDANRPLELVVSDVRQHVAAFLERTGIT